MAKPRSMQPLLRERALSYPDTEEAFPWGERVIKVKKKVFIFMGDVTKPDVLQMAMKLPFSGPAVLKRPYAKPSGYGLGKSGWVHIDPKAAKLDVADVFAWLDESYRAVAPKTSIAKLENAQPAKPAKAKPAKTKPAKRVK
ncbi:hypothetical protein BH09MYX1_BH09MYX1_10170 [soil metagenome]